MNESEKNKSKQEITHLSEVRTARALEEKARRAAEQDDLCRARLVAIRAIRLRIPAEEVSETDLVSARGVVSEYKPVQLADAIHEAENYLSYPSKAMQVALAERAEREWGHLV